jgi:integrase
MPRPILLLRAADTLFLKEARAAGTHIGNHSMRATGITDYLKSDGTLEHAQIMAAHSSQRTTKLYDRRNDETALDEYEKVKISRVETGFGPDWYSR